MSSIPVLTPNARHFARRWSGGLNPHLVTQVQHRGGGRPWFTSQLSPAQLADTYGEEIKTWFPRLRRTPEQLFNLQAGGGEGVWETLADLGRFSVAMQIHSNRQVKEQLVSFWSNLLHVPIDSDPAGFWRVAYDQTIRRYSLDTFENLLQHAITHPAMGLSLNNAESTKDAPNENLGQAPHRPGSGSGTRPSRRPTPPATTTPDHSRCWASTTTTPIPTDVPPPRRT